VSISTQPIWAQLPLGREVSVITVDTNGLAALAKPSGVLSHPNSTGEEKRSLLQAAYNLEGEYYHWTDAQGVPQKVWLLNRLDSSTSGVILLCADETLAGVMRQHFKRKRVRKVYHALVFGKPHSSNQIWRDRLAVQKQGGRIRTSTTGHIPAECKMTLVRSWGALSHLKLEPTTGRSHQLRVQCAKRHLPIVGDATYGDFGQNRDFERKMGQKRLFLHSLETTFDYEYAGRVHFFSATAPLPIGFEGRR
jgi:tRNA pseudouridine65 synthase